VVASGILPVTGVKISMVVFGALTLLILGTAAFLASRPKHPKVPQNLFPLPQGGFKSGPAGQTFEEGGDTGRPSSRPEG
jgi:hypothetical protein